MSHKFCFDGRVHSVELEKTPTGYLASVDGRTYQLAVDQARDGELRFHLDGRPVSLYWAADGPLRWVWLDGRTYLLDTRLSLAKGGARTAQTDGVLRAPMPGAVREVRVAAGEAVSRGQVLVLVEAMKMEFRIQAPDDGQVGRVLVEEGDIVERDQVLVELIS